MQARLEPRRAEYTYDELTRMAAAARPFSAAHRSRRVSRARRNAAQDRGALPRRRSRRRPRRTPNLRARFWRASRCATGRCWKASKRSPAARIEVIHIVGGGSRNAVLNQFVADCTGRRVVAGPSEATAIGNILVQAMGAGELSGLDEIREVVRRSCSPATYEPRPSEQWEAAYAKYVSGQINRYSAGPKLYVWPALAWNSFSLPAYRIFTGFDSVAVSVAFTSLPSFHSISTPIPPRARSPVTLPDGKAEGSAGSRLMNAASPACTGVRLVGVAYGSWLCSSISAMPAVAPKLPSIWNGGCASNRFGNRPAFVGPGPTPARSGSAGSCKRGRRRGSAPRG